MIRPMILITLAAAGIANAGTIDPQQEQFFTGKYGKQKNAPRGAHPVRLDRERHVVLLP